MSDRLDDDVLLLILDELATPSSDYDVYLASKKALYNVCLASSRLRRLAQPQLFRQVWVVKQSQAGALQSSGVVASLGKGTLWYTVGKREYEDSLPEAVKMAHVLPNVEKLLLSGPWTPRIPAHIESFAKLRHLSLVHSEIQSGMVFKAPHLEQLDIHHSFVYLPDAREWLQPVYLPALRILSVVSVGEGLLLGRFELSQVLGPAMLAQLDVLQTDESSLNPQSSLGLGDAPPVLFFDPPRDRPTFPRHSIHPMEKELQALISPAAVRGLVGALERSASSYVAVGPRVVVLPQEVRTLATQHQNLANGVRRLEQACGGAVRILWSDEGMDPMSGGVSREFVRYARELKAAQAAGVLAA